KYENTRYITPDIYIYRVGNNYEVMLNDDSMPRLKINHAYQNILKLEKNSLTPETKEYLMAKLKSAIWFIKSVHQRQRTILKIARSIIKFQRDFFDKGVGHLKPLVLREVAEDINMHESTVSRVTTNKYVHTPLGIFLLKYFFSSAISMQDGNTLASESIKTRIKEITEKENHMKPLSDQAIADLLDKIENVNIARRTVTKYREMLGILPSNQRKTIF
ncbi:MAG: RNA polymerase sigma-54 factor, partial [bacterium]|nr:RNA polymerase sigma-54 factor [bacterium]